MIKPPTRFGYLNIKDGLVKSFLKNQATKMIGLMVAFLFLIKKYLNISKVIKQYGKRTIREHFKRGY